MAMRAERKFCLMTRDEAAQEPTVEEQIAKLQAAVSTGYARGKLELGDRKDWYD